MGQVTGIEWTDHTFNPWRGCTKVSPGCAHCYAETLSKRNPNVLGVWGPNGTRVVAAESYWRQPVKWNREAEIEGVRRRVFCASLADVFEDRPELDEPRLRLFDLILSTPHLDWLLLTKRPAFMRDWLAGRRFFDRRGGGVHEWGAGWDNVWLGTSVEDQKRADERVPVLLEIPAAVHFLSCEPLLGTVDLKEWLYVYHDRPSKRWACGGRVSWVIVGGESGPESRPMHPDWARSLRDQCRDAGAAFFFKQWGEFGPEQIGEVRHVRVASGVPMDEPAGMFRVGKKAAGKQIDGRAWCDFPAPQPAGSRP